MNRDDRYSRYPNIAYILKLLTLSAASIYPLFFAETHLMRATQIDFHVGAVVLHFLSTFHRGEV